QACRPQHAGHELATNGGVAWLGGAHRIDRNADDYQVIWRPIAITHAVILGTPAWQGSTTDTSDTNLTRKPHKLPGKSGQTGVICGVVASRDGPDDDAAGPPSCCRDGANARPAARHAKGMTGSR